MRLTWDDLGHATEPGIYNVNGERVNITAGNLAVWKEKPHAVFTAKWFAGGYNGKGCYMLGSHEV